MDNKRWTQEQTDAFTLRGGNILVAAAAGSGKTAVLVERIIRMISDPDSSIDIDRLLVLTFTNAAAAEMRERVSEAIMAELDRLAGASFQEEQAEREQKQEQRGQAELDSRRQEFLARQLSLLQRASITTIHSFCLDVIRKYFYTIGLDPSFRIGNETEMELLKADVLEELFEEQYTREDPGFLHLVDCFGTHRGDEALMQAVLDIYEFSCSHPFPEKWLNEVTEAYASESGHSAGYPGKTDSGGSAESAGTDASLYAVGKIDRLPWMQELKDIVRMDLEGAVNTLHYAEGLASAPGGPAEYLDNLEEDLEILNRLIKLCEGSWEDIYQGFAGASFGKLKRCGKEVNPDLQEKVKKLREEIKEVVKGLKEEFCGRSSQDICDELDKAYPFIKSLVLLVKEFRKAYAEEKTARGLVDFNDLEHYCLKILTAGAEIKDDSVSALKELPASDGPVPSPVAMELRERFEEVLVDEYQDINQVQEMILQMVSRQGEKVPNMFMVGDVKQSIYRFRLASPELFLNKYLNFPAYRANVTEAEGKAAGPTLENAAWKIDLARNFRNRQEIIDGTNYIFRQVMSERMGEICYDDRAELRYGAGYPEPAETDCCLSRNIELYMVDKSTGAEDEEGNELSSVQREAAIAAGKILEMTGRQKIFDKKSGMYRPVAFRDIVILMRATRGAAEVFRKELMLRNIPVHSDGDAAFFETVEVQTILALLKVIDNPLQDIPLAGVLRSPIFGLGAEELAKIRLFNVKGYFFDAVEKAAEEMPVLKQFLADLDRWRTLSRRNTVVELIRSVYDDTGFFIHAGSMTGGAQRQANLRLFQEYAEQFENTLYRGLFKFIKYIEKIRDKGQDLASGKVLGENEDVVKIMSIHKSKGLEFPVVILAGMGKGFNLQDTNRKILLHKRLGIGPNLVQPEIRLSYPTIVKMVIRRKMKLESMAEEMRVLYVALTRAREKLILTGAVRETAASAEKWCRSMGEKQLLLSPAVMAMAKCCLDWIGPALVRHPDGSLLRELAPSGKLMSYWPMEDTSRWEIHVIGDETEEAADSIGAVEAEAEEASVQPPESTAVRTGELTASRTGGLPADLTGALSDCWSADEILRDISTGINSIPHGPYYEGIKRKLGWEYPYIPVTQIRSKTSVSSLKQLKPVVQLDELVIDEPVSYKSLSNVGAKRKLTGAEKGNLMHSVMEHLDFDQIRLLYERQISQHQLECQPQPQHQPKQLHDLLQEHLRGQLSSMVQSEILSKEEADYVETDKIASFLLSGLGTRLLTARTVKRELPFTLAVGVSELYDDLTGEEMQREKILVQGIIDCFLIDREGKNILIDYKTDYVNTNELNSLVNRYNLQLSLYRRALKELMGIEVDECYLYLFSLGMAVGTGVNERGDLL